MGEHLGRLRAIALTGLLANDGGLKAPAGTRVSLFAMAITALYLVLLLRRRIDFLDVILEKMCVYFYFIFLIIIVF